MKPTILTTAISFACMISLSSSANAQEFYIGEDGSLEYRSDDYSSAETSRKLKTDSESSKRTDLTINQMTSQLKLIESYLKKSSLFSEIKHFYGIECNFSPEVGNNCILFTDRFLLGYHIDKSYFIRTTSKNDPHKLKYCVSALNYETAPSITDNLDLLISIVKEKINYGYKKIPILDGEYFITTPDSGRSCYTQIF